MSKTDLQYQTCVSYCGESLNPIRRQLVPPTLSCSMMLNTVVLMSMSYHASRYYDPQHRELGKTIDDFPPQPV